MIKIDEEIVMELWKEIKAQSLDDSGIHLSVQVLPGVKKPNVSVVVEVCREEGMFARAKEYNHDTPYRIVKQLTEIGVRTKEASIHDIRTT